MKKQSSLLQLLSYLRPYKLRIIGLCMIVLVANSLMLLIPYITGIMIDAISLVDRSIDYGTLIKGAWVILLSSIVIWGTMTCQNIWVLKIAQDITVRLRKDTFSKLTKLPMSYFDKNTKGNLISILTADIEGISEMISADAITLLTGFVTVIGSFVLMLSISIRMTSVFIITIPMMFIGARFISKSARKRYRKKKKSYGTLCGYSEEMITAQKTIKVYGIEGYNEEKFETLATELRETGESAEFYSSMMMPIMNTINNFNYTMICVLGAILAIRGEITIGNISTFIIYSKRFANPIVNTANIINMLQSSLAACDRVFGIINEKEEEYESIDHNTECKPITSIRGEVVFKDVSFEYTPDTKVLKGINLHVEPGQKIAIVGATGSGKTTLVSLLMRFYEMGEGDITIDGQSIKELPLDYLRQHFALILQESWLFEGDIYENIAYAAPEDRKNKEYIKKLCHEIKVDEFIDSLPRGYESMLRGDSQGISLGQKQLLNIARTFICDPPIFILDEATSSIDPQTEVAIKVTTDSVTEGKTSFIIAHRLSTIINADKIVVMKDGEIKEIGTHAELLAKRGVYNNLYHSQFGEEIIPSKTNQKIV